MKVALIGASGFVGSAILNELVERGHEVTAITRNSDKVKEAKGVTAVKADASKEDEVANAVKGHDVVVNAFNPGWGNPPFTKILYRGTRRYKRA